jgi:hypothetical protein
MGIGKDDLAAPNLPGDASIISEAVRLSFRFCDLQLQVKILLFERWASGGIPGKRPASGGRSVRA